ncbi:MAG TPA: hypothetical protein PLB25_21325, partial [Rhodoferax sp.]|nr:hypothetical protein [Rhodoferax sp.]
SDLCQTTRNFAEWSVACELVSNVFDIYKGCVQGRSKVAVVGRNSMQTHWSRSVHHSTHCADKKVHSDHIIC